MASSRRPEIGTIQESSVAVLLLERRLSGTGDEASGKAGAAEIPTLSVPLYSLRDQRGRPNSSTEPLRVHAYADYAVRFRPAHLLEVAFGDAADELDPARTSFNLLLNGEVVQTRLLRETEDEFILVPAVGSGAGNFAALAGTTETTPLFSSAIGFAALSIRLRASSGDRLFEEELTAEPVEVLLPEGRHADNLAAMAKFVAEKYEHLLSVTDIEARDDPLHGREEALEDILHAFERELPYFRANARFLFTKETALLPLSKAQAPSSAAAAHLATHPDLFEPAPYGRGIRVNGRHLMPQRILVDATTKSGATYENLAAVAFLLRIVDSLRIEKGKVEEVLLGLERMQAPTGFVSAAEPMFGIRARQMQSFIEKLEGLISTFRRLSEQYRKAFGLADPERTESSAKHAKIARLLASASRAAGTLPRRTEVFRGVAPYRRIYEAMARWFALDELHFEKEKELSAFLSRSRFYEVFALMKILDGLERSGFRLVRKTRFDYAAALPAGLLATTSAGLTCANTFHFERAIDGENQARVTVYYEPLIRMAGEAPLNGLGLCRTSAFSYDASTNSLVPLNHAAADRAVYTPDIVIAAHDGNRCRWFIADAKYASVETAAAQEALPLAFKYLMSVSPIRPADETAGLWLLCGKRSPGDDPDEAASCLNAFGAAMGVTGRVDVHFEPLAGSSDSDSPSNLVEAVCAAFRGF